jgi:hypothetical protein
LIAVLTVGFLAVIIVVCIENNIYQHIDGLNTRLTLQEQHTAVMSEHIEELHSTKPPPKGRKC